MRTIEEIMQGMDRLEFMTLAAKDLKFWCEKVLGIIVKPFHEEWFKLFKENQFVNIIAPTGHGKTLLMGVAIATWIAYNQRNKEILIISNTMEQSTGILTRVKEMISDNELLQELIPEKHLTRWSKTEIHTTTGCKIYCKPYSANIRSYHVDYLLADEDAQYRDQAIFFKWVITRVTAKKGKLVAISTPITEVDLPHKLLKNPKFVSKVCIAYVDEENTIPVFPELYSKEELLSIKDTVGSLAFDREYLCSTKSVENALFPPNLVVDCFDEKVSFQLSEGDFVYIGCDFALARGSTADYSVFTVIENVGHQTIIRRIERYRGKPIDFQTKRLKELHRIYKAKSILLDVSAMGEGFFQDLRQEGLPVVACDFAPKHRNNYLITLRKFVEGKRDEEGKLKERRLVIPRDFNDIYCERMGDLLFNELTAFIITETPTGFTTYKTTAAHDDIVMSLALAISGASKQRKYVDSFFCE